MENDPLASVSVDLGGPVWLSRVRLFPQDDKACEGYGFPIDFVLECSLDGGTCWAVKTVTNHNGGQPLARPSPPQTFEVTGRYRHVRVRATADGETSVEGWGWFERFVNDGVDSSSGEAHGWSSALLATPSPQDLVLRLDEPTVVSRLDIVVFRVFVATDAACITWKQVASRASHPDPGRFARTIGFRRRIDELREGRRNRARPASQGLPLTDGGRAVPRPNRTGRGTV